MPVVEFSHPNPQNFFLLRPKHPLPKRLSTLRFFFQPLFLSPLSLPLSLTPHTPSQQPQLQPKQNKQTNSSDHQPRPQPLLPPPRRLPPRHHRRPRRRRARPQPRRKARPGLLPQVPRLRPPWTKWPDYDRVLFVNSIIRTLWPYYNAAIGKIAVDATVPIFKDICSKVPAGSAAVDRHREAEPGEAPARDRRDQGLPHQGRLVRVRGPAAVGLRAPGQGRRQAEIRSVRRPRPARGRGRAGPRRRPHLAQAPGRGAPLPGRRGGLAARACRTTTSVCAW